MASHNNATYNSVSGKSHQNRWWAVTAGQCERPDSRREGKTTGPAYEKHRLDQLIDS